MILDTTSKVVRAYLAGAVSANQPEFNATWADHDAGTPAFTPGHSPGVLNNTTHVNLVGSPAAGVQRNLRGIWIFNADSASVTVTVETYDGANARRWIKGVLAPSEVLAWEYGGTWHVYTAEGLTKEPSGGTIPGTVPIGCIVLWSGTIASIPVDWNLCDGTMGTPDLRDKFVVGARQDDAGAAKTNIEGALKVTGGATGHSHSDHGALSHSGFSISDHTGLTHGLSIGNHPDLTHAVLSHPSQALSHADHTVPSFSHAHDASTLDHADISLASFTGSHASAANASAPSGSIASHAAGSVPSHTHASSAGVSSFATSTNRSGMLSINSHTGASAANASGPSRSFPSHAAISVPSGSHSHAATTITQPAHSLGSFSGTEPSVELSHADHSLPSLSHQDIGTHLATDYGVHSFTAPPAHGAAGTVTHSFTESSAHTVSAHDTVLQLPNYYALAYIMRVA